MIYTEETYDTMIRRSYDYSQEKQDTCPNWKVLRTLYEKNYMFQASLPNIPIQKIPKKVHQIWLGSSFPEQYSVWANSWKKFNPDWEYKLWTDDNVGDVYLTREQKQIFHRIKHIAQKSDYLRYHILNQFGGLYVDTDFECLKSFDDLLFLDFFTGIGYPADMELYIGLIASIPEHPILKNVIKGMVNIPDDSHWRKVFNSTGSFYFTRKFFETVNKNTKGVVAFPMDFFYPFPNNFRKKGQPYKYVKPCSYAIHHWAVSWSKKNQEILKNN